MKKALVLVILALFGITALSARCGINKPPKQCYVGGCSSQLCTDQKDVISTCEWRDEYACYTDATCERQKNGECGWTSTSELRECLANPPSTDPVPPQCYVGGCSRQLCTDDPNAVSTCEWRDDYICYESATCERQDDGQCGWTQTQDLQDCLDNPPQPSEPEPVPGPGDELPGPDYCYITGCSSQLCSAEAVVESTCEWREEFQCYEGARCERQANGDCGWTQTEELKECLADPPVYDGECYVGGCSGQLCTEVPNAISTCEWTPAFACYSGATCERQENGRCGWTQTEELQECLENPPNDASA